MTLQDKRSDDVTIDEQQPVDSLNLVYLAMVLLGCGILFPYNAMLTATDYFDHIWPDKHLASFAPLMCTLLSPFLQLFMVKISSMLSYRSRIVGGFFVYTTAVILVPIVAEYIKDREKSYLWVLALMIAIGASNAILSATIFALGAMFPPKYSQGIMMGNGWSGVIVCAIRIVTKLIFKEDDAGYRASAFCFFGSAAFTTALCIAAYAYIANAAFSQMYFVDPTLQPAVAKTGGSLNGGDSYDPLLANEHLDYHAGGDLPRDVSIDSKAKPGMLSVAGKMWPMLLNIFAVFFMTFLVFPGVILSSDSTIPKITSNWLPVILITLFNVVDLFGRSLPAYAILFSPKTLPFAIWARFLLYPLFVLLGPTTVIENTWILFGVMVVFSASNGYLSTLCFIHSGSYVEDEERSISGGLMSVFLTTGITSGSLVAIAISKLAHW